MMDVCRNISIGWPAKCDRVRERESLLQVFCALYERVCVRVYLSIYLYVCVLKLTHHPHVIDPSCTPGVTTNP